MKKIQVIIKDQTTLELKEDGQKGDYIDLTDCQEIDFAPLNKLIDEGKDEIYLKRLGEAQSLTKAEALNSFNADKERLNQTILQLRNDLVKTKDEFIAQLKQKESDDDIKYLEKINSLNKKIEVMELEATNDKEICLKSLELKFAETKLALENNYRDQLLKRNTELEELKLLHANELHQYEAKQVDEVSELNKKLMVQENELKKILSEQSLNEQLKINQATNKLNSDYQEQLSRLRTELDTLKATNDLSLKLALDSQEKSFIVAKNKEIETIAHQYQESITTLQEENLKLNYQKSIKNIKVTGEDLEAWCDSEVKSYMQNGFTNCTWNKDNEVIKEDDELKGSKADFIFNIYSTTSHLDSELLASVCLEMKDENPDSEAKNKKTNEFYYKKLSLNRDKKNCQYALLVSNLELDRPNYPVITKIPDYPDMYFVRPAYLLTFLNMLVSLTNKFKDLLNEDEKKQFELKESLDLIEEFEKLKDTYLNKPLLLLQGEIEKISKASASIKASSIAIDDACDKINERYLSEIQKKLDKFDIKKLRNKLDLLNEMEEE